MAAPEPVSKTAAAALCSTPAFAREMVAGGVAGVVAKTAVAPLDRVMLMRQVGVAPGDAGAVQMLRDIGRREGLAGLYRGNGTNALRGFQNKALYFMLYERYRRFLLGAAGPSLGGGPVVDLLAGSAAGGTAMLVTYPLDLARTRLACQGAAGGMSGVLRSAYAEGGSVRGLYRGVCPSLARVLPASGLNLCAYEALTARLPHEEPGRREAAKVACGIAAGLVASTATYPLDVVRRQIQLRGGGGGTLQTFRAIVQAQGARRLYSGLGITYVKRAPSVAVSLVAYDHMKALLKLPPRDHKPTGGK
ncbi:mitochondrial carrier protein CoAc1-like [Oryza brachyantha]|uniref:mitochondrial carrier protein CoAc1-like n=1 Tax=Oryza brachyantha TaxID=4533 RepID=UPI001ADBD119|nr:mitochondrial carrier protein CoAc1-like [Oryza brachyantha]